MAQILIIFADESDVETTAEHTLLVARCNHPEWVAANDVLCGDTVLGLPPDGTGRLVREVLKRAPEPERKTP